MTPNQFKKRWARLFPAATQKESRALAAAALGVSLNCINHWEYGDRKVPEYAVVGLKRYEELKKCLEAQKEEA